MNILQITPARKAVETTIEQGAKIYAFVSEILTATTILWFLNFIATAIEKTYKAGYYFGIFYRQHLHHLVIKLIAGIIFVLILACDGGAILYRNRHKIMPVIESCRHWIGSQFIYA